MKMNRYRRVENNIYYVKIKRGATSRDRVQKIPEYWLHGIRH